MKAAEEVARLRDKLQSGDLPGDEPVFVLRARDVLASLAVEYWLSSAVALGVPTDKLVGARDCAEAMRRWPVKQIPGRPKTRTGTVQKRGNRGEGYLVPPQG